MSTAAVALAGLSLAAWIYLLALHGGFWRIRERLAGAVPDRAHWPAVRAVCPARNEAAVIGASIVSLLSQDYPGDFKMVLVDDHSDDGTADIASEAATASSATDRLRIIMAEPLPTEWTGKLWALSRGVAAAGEEAPDAPWLWFSDADIVASPTMLRRLVAKAEEENLDLVSLMVELSCRGIWERLLIPPFVFFFRKLYPFSRVNNPADPTAAAAGGCLLVRRASLEHAGGLERIRDALIDDCTLARAVKSAGREGGGRIWLGQTRASRSIRPYEGLSGIWSMVARSAYTQLRHSPLLLAGTLVGMFVVYLAPPLAVAAAPLHESAPATALGLAAWLIMVVCFWPTLRYYGQPVWLAPLLPLAAAFYVAMTADSALAHLQGRGGRWKGRIGRRTSEVATRRERAWLRLRGHRRKGWIRSR